MAVTAIPLTTGSSTTNATSYTTASITPTPGRLVLVAVLATVGSGTVGVTLTGCGLNWVKIAQTPDAARTMHLFRGMGPAPTPGALTIAGSASMTSALWQVTEFNGVDPSGTDGDGAIVQSVNARPGSGTTINVPFPAPVDPANSTYGTVGVAVQEPPAAGGAPWASLGTTTQNAPTSGLLAEFAAPALQGVTASWTTAAASFIVGAEIKAAPAAADWGFGRGFGLSFGAAAIETSTGAAAAEWSFSGAAQGTAAYEGYASGTWGFAGSATGHPPPVGQAAGTWTFTGSASGTTDRVGAATAGAWGFTGTAVGTRIASGTATAGTWQYTGSEATGRTPTVVDTSHAYGFATLTSAVISTAALAPTPTAGAALVGNTTSTADITSQPGRATLQTDR